MNSRRLQVKNEINMTPLIDVILQLIIFFMITTTFKSAPGISLDLPQSKTAQKVSSSSVLQVRVLSEDEIYVDKTQTNLQGLRTILQQKVAAINATAGTTSAGTTAGTGAGTATGAVPGAAGTASGIDSGSGAGTGSAAPPISNIHAILDGNSGVSYQLIVSVLDELRLCGIQNVSLMTREEKVTQ